jgi:CcmD family protein
MKRYAITLVLFVLMLAAPAFLRAQAQPQSAPSAPAGKTAAAQDGFVPVTGTPTGAQETIPAPRLVAIAYGFIWVVLFGYVWSVRSRLTRVEREMESVSRRVASGSAGRK